MRDTSEIVHGTVEMLRPDDAANWTGLDLVPFETIAERFIDIEHEGQTTTLAVSFAKPFHIEGKGWACPYRISALGSDHVTPARGADSVHAIQMAMDGANSALTELAQHHRMSFLGDEDLGFARVSGSNAALAKCPGMNMGVSS